MKKRIICTVLATTMLLSQTASAALWQMRRNQLVFDSKIGFFGNVTLQFASAGGSFIRPITKRYGESISLESYIPTKYGYVSHKDAYVYQWYANLINIHYNERVSKDATNNCVIAYRNNKTGKFNAHFAKEAIDFIREKKSCYIIIGDFTVFSII